MTPRWYLAVKKEKYGPYSMDQLRQFAASGRLLPNDMLLQEGAQKWVAAREFSDLFGTAAITAQAVPPPVRAIPPPSLPQASASESGFHVTQMREGLLSITGPYQTAFATLEQALTECGVTINQSSPEQGLIRGKCKYGINLFGITVTATMYAAGAETRVEIAANLTDAFDTFGACRKKVAQISDRISDLAQSAHGHAAPVQPVTAMSAAPRYEQRAGVSYQGKAITGFCLSIVGLCFGPASIVGLIMCAMALTGMSTSPNQDGKGCAIAGTVVGFIALLGWIVILLLLQA